VTRSGCPEQLRDTPVFGGMNEGWAAGPRLGPVRTGEELAVEVSEEIHISVSRLAAWRAAGKLGFSRIESYHLMTSVSELAGNLFFHASGGGRLTITPVRRGGLAGIQVVAEDEGPGIDDLELALQDGFSTNGGLGSGLPGVKRLMDEFEILTRRGGGTRIVARIWKSGR